MSVTLNNTAVVILGLLAGGAKSGYDIKGIVDRSTRFFWGASYRQIYPELRRLEEQVVDALAQQLAALADGRLTQRLGQTLPAAYATLAKDFDRALSSIHLFPKKPL